MAIHQILKEKFGGVIGGNAAGDNNDYPARVALDGAAQFGKEGVSISTMSH